MKANPLEISPETFFITGHDKTTNGTDNESFSEMEKILTEKGYKVLNPFGMTVKERCLCLVACDNVVSLIDWDRWENSVKEVQIARTMGKNIVHAPGFERWEKAKAIAANS